MLAKLRGIVLVLALVSLALIVGREIGIHHAIAESEITVSESGITINLDGNEYRHY